MWRFGGCMTSKSIRWKQQKVESSWLNTCIEVKIADTSYVGLHRFCKMSKQMPPSAYTFGWNIFETKRTVGGLLGYSSVNSIVNLNVPSSNGVSCGPKITAFHIIILLSVGAPETPVGGSSWSLQLQNRNREFHFNWTNEMNINKN